MGKAYSLVAGVLGSLGGSRPQKAGALTIAAWRRAAVQKEGIWHAEVYPKGPVDLRT